MKWRARSSLLLLAAGSLFAVAFSAISCGSDSDETNSSIRDPYEDGSIQGRDGDSSVTSKDGGKDSQPTVVMGGPGCGFASAAFCDTFDAPATRGARAGELLGSAWSVSRLSPATTTGDGLVFPIGPATLRSIKNGTTLPECRAGIAPIAFPPDDTRVCAAAGGIQSPHLLVAAAAQNYGSNSYRIRQPFDFAGRTGTIVFDAEAYTPNNLLGWVSLEVTDDPIPTPGFAKSGNFEGTPIPRNAFELHFSDNDCPRVGIFAKFSNYVETDLDNADRSTCPVPTKWGHLNHFEVKVSQTMVEVFATPFSANGTTFAAPTKIFSSSVNLPFARGYVHLTVHNHATLKYWDTYGDGFQNLDSWVARFDNVGFDGPVIGDFSETEVAPPVPASPPTTSLDTAWIAPAKSAGTTGPLKIPGVVRTGFTRARLALNAWYCTGCGGDVTAFVLNYRLNGGAWHDRKLTAGEITGLSKGSGAASQLLDVPMNELVDGNNTVEFATTNVPLNYPPAVMNIDLILDKGP